MKKIILLILLHFLCYQFNAQPKVVDKVIAEVDKNIILYSDFQNSLLEYSKNSGLNSDSLRDKVFEELLFQKLLLAQADKDSVITKDEQVDAELERRMAYYLAKFGSEENFYNFYGKSSAAFKDELRDDVKDQLTAQTMQGKIVGEIKVTPQEVRNFFATIPTDSIPLINSEIELGQLIKKPQISPSAKKAALEKIQSLRKRVVSGESSMTTICTIYTDDTGSAKTGGVYKDIMKGQFVPEFDAVAFKMKPGDEVSEIFETPYGYHFLKLLSRRGDLMDVQHILISPKIDNSDILNAKLTLDSIYEKISKNEVTFCDATAKYSDDKDSKNNCGTIVNPASGTIRFEMEQLAQIEQNLVFLLDKMNVGEITKPMIYMSNDSKQAYRIIYLKNRTNPHYANLKEDYQRLQNMTMASKQKKLISDWIYKKSKSIFIKIDPEFSSSKFEFRWNIQNN
jgi:peptidyl-prolyl cis-trans isomerase SurA